MRALRLAAVALVLACSWVEVATAVTSRGEFIRRGDALCAQVKRELVPIRARAEAAQRLPRDQQWAAGADIWADQIRIQKRFVGRLQAIGVPPNDPAARQIVAGLDRGVALAARVQKAFAGRNANVLPKALRDYVTFTVTVNGRVNAYGFRVCGS